MSDLAGEPVLPRPAGPIDRGLGMEPEVITPKSGSVLDVVSRDGRQRLAIDQLGPPQEGKNGGEPNNGASALAKETRFEALVILGIGVQVTAEDIEQLESFI